MTRAVLALSPDTRIEDAARLLIQRKITGAPVIGADNVPVAVVSLVDLVEPGRAGRRVGELPHRTLVSIRATDEIEAAASRMLADDVRRLPVLDGHGRMIGIVTATDLLRGFVRVVG